MRLLIRQLLASLGTMHRSEIIHTDIKPGISYYSYSIFLLLENVMFYPLEMEEKAKPDEIPVCIPSFASFQSYLFIIFFVLL